MKHAYVFPGQGAQAVGMGKDLYDNVPEAKELFEKANEILGFRITDIMFAGTDEELKQTKVTQPAVFLHSVIMAKALGVKPDAAAGHSLGEFSALVVAGALSFEDGLKLVSKRALAMQAACEAQPGTASARGRSVPLAADGARQAGAGEGDQRIAVPSTRLPRIPERGRKTLYRSRPDQSEPDRTADGSGTLDLHREEHARRRRDGVHRTRPRHCTSGSYQESKPRSNGRIEIDTIK